MDCSASGEADRGPRFHLESSGLVEWRPSSQVVCLGTLANTGQDWGYRSGRLDAGRLGSQAGAV